MAHDTSIAAVISASALVLTIVLGISFCIYSLVAVRKTRELVHDDGEDEADKMAESHIPASVMFNNIDYYIENNLVLSGIQGIVHSGEVMAVMGLAGSGKVENRAILYQCSIHVTFYYCFQHIIRKMIRPTSSMYSLEEKRAACRMARSTLTGVRLTTEIFHRLSGMASSIQTVSRSELRLVQSNSAHTRYVRSKDEFLSTLTVLETILYSIELGSPHLSVNARSLAARALQRLGIYDIKDSILGTPGGWKLYISPHAPPLQRLTRQIQDTGISTEQRRRLSVACQLVKSPSILFIEEPAAG